MFLLDLSQESKTESEQTVNSKLWSQGYSLVMRITWLLLTEIQHLDPKTKERAMITMKRSIAISGQGRALDEFRSSAENATSKLLLINSRINRGHLWIHDLSQIAQWLWIKINNLIRKLLLLRMMLSQVHQVYSQKCLMRKNWLKKYECHEWMKMCRSKRSYLNFL